MAFFIFPIQIRDAFFHAKVKWNGIAREDVGLFDTLQISHCKAGEPCQCVLFIHGLADRALTWRKIMWQPASAWKKPVHLFAVNLPGAGRTPLYEDLSRFAVTKLAEDLVTAFKPRCQDWILVGNSFGGWLSLRMASLNPAPFKSILLLDAAGVRGSYADIVPLYLNLNAANVRELEVRAFAHPYQHIPDWFYGLMVSHMKKFPIRQMIESQMKTDEFLDDYLPKIEAPTGILWGQKDRITPLSFADRFAALLPHVVFDRKIEDCGHIPQHECPEAVVQGLNDLL